MAFTCDIILLSYESPELLKKCVESVLDSTRVPSRLIIVDNASRDPEVRRYLEGVHGRGSVTVEKLFSEVNAGFAGGTNKGLRLAEAPFVCLLNNDCIVTDGWLEEMVDVARSRADIGLVDPQSNTFGSRPEEGLSIEEHAASLAAARKGEFTEMGHAIGFACLVKKEVIDKIGYLDEVYEGVCYEDTDFSLRAQKAGFISVIAEGAYVFHKEQASREKLRGKEAVYSRNRKIFEDRWGRLHRSFCLEDVSSGMPAVRDSYDALKGLARRRVFVDLWVSGVDDSFRDSVLSGMVKHADITMKFFNGRFTGAYALWKILTKKKRYDAVFLPAGVLSALVSAAKPIHGAEVFIRKGDSAQHVPSGRIFSLNDAGMLTEFIKQKRK